MEDSQNSNKRQQREITAGLIIIGNEILSGRTQDINTKYLGERLTEHGIKLKEVIILPDEENTIASNAWEYCQRFDYVFTTGGIGPTHDDITAQSIATALGRNLEINEAAVEAIENYYGSDSAELSQARVKMAYLPEGSSIITNSLTGAPGFRVENIFVLAGVPDIMRAMFENIAPLLRTGSKIYNRSIDIYRPESEIASELSKIQKQFSQVEIGSYPFSENFKLGCQVAMNSQNEEELNQAYSMVKKLLPKDN